MTSSEPAKRPPSVVFDLDGTLVDSLGDITAALNAALQGARPPLAALSAAEVRPLVGRGARVLLEQALALRLGRTAEAAELDDAVDRFEEAYAEDPVGQTRPFPGIEAVLDALAAEGLALAVLTNKPVALARLVVERLLPGRFAAVLGPEDGARKPGPEALARVAEVTGTRPLGLVGDSWVDVEAARQGGVPCAAVTWGLGDKASLGGPHVTRVDEPGELLEVVKRWRA